MSLCKDINNLMQNFLWQHMNKNSKIYWMSWEKIGRSKSVGGMGFRDLVLFNKAMLAKQWWRFIQNPTSLTAQIFKAKYYPSGDFLGAALGNRPSYVWRSIWQARELLSQGLIWRVGDGKSIKIWGDRWLPTPHTFKVQTCPQSMDCNSLVASLIDPLTKTWNSELLQEVFQHEEALVISNIPLYPLQPPDRLIWRGTTNEVFSVRSAYHLGKELQDNMAAQSSISRQDQDVWKPLWALIVPNAVRNFAWRACHEVLLTRANLRRIKVVEVATCPCCESAEENLIHAIWACPAAQDVWGSHLSYFHKCSWVVSSFRKLFAICLQQFPK
jgi:hypothetical protein